MIDSRPVPETLLGQHRTGQIAESILSNLYARACLLGAMVATALWWIAWYVGRVDAVQTRSKSPELCACSLALAKHTRRSLRHHCYGMHGCDHRLNLANTARVEFQRAPARFQRPLRHTWMVFGLAVVNPHVEAHRLLREQARHKKRLAEIAGQKAVTVTTWDRGAPTDHKASYGHLQPGRHTPLTDAERALRMRQANRQQKERLEHHKKREPAQHVREAAQRKLGMEPAHQRRCEQGRVDLDKGHARIRRQAQASLARDNQAHQQRIKGVQARVAPPSVLRVLRGEVEGKPDSFRTLQ